MRCCVANIAAMRPSKKDQKEKTPPFWRGLSLRTHLSTNLTRSFAFTLLSRFLALPARILLLLSGLLATTLLLARFLSGGLILLAGILVRISHRDLPCFQSQRNNRGTRTWLRGTCFLPNICGLGQSRGSSAVPATSVKMISAQAFSAQLGGVAAMGSRC